MKFVNWTIVKHKLAATLAWFVPAKSLQPRLRVQGGIEKKYAVLVLVSLFVVPAAVWAEVSTNFGWVSEYIFRGIAQDDSSAYCGVDYGNSGFYAGTWVADVGDGAEVDLYLGYGGQITESFSYGIGTTGSFGRDFDGEYYEAGYGFDLGGFDVSISVVHGTSSLLGTKDNSIIFGIGKTLCMQDLSFLRAAHNDQ